MLHTTVIAEAGVNHNGSLDIAVALVDAAVQAGADIIKFQTFKASTLVTSDAKQADYQIVNTARAEPQIDMLRRLELDHNSHKVLI
jgi:N-acetylneuraminate synthase